MATFMLVFGAVSLVVLAIQLSCFFAYHAPAKKVVAPSNGCFES
jgi:hypothetical protein